MSQNHQNSQPPSSPEPEANQQSTPVDSTTVSSQKPSQRVQPVWKSTIIQILRGTIGLLEAAVEKLETQPSPSTATTPNNNVETLHATSLHATSLQGWNAVLGKIRSLLPANLSTKLSNTALTGIIAGIAVIIVWTTTTVFAGKPTEVASVPPTEEAPPATVTIPPESTPLQAPPVESTPTPESTPPTTPPVESTPTPESTPPTTPPVESTPIPESTPPTTPSVEETPTPELTPLPEPEPEPTPILRLTPEQTLIAAIENQVGEVSERFVPGLINSIRANFRSSNLTVIISDEWYNIERKQQDKLAAEMLQRSKELDFTHLEIIDSQGKLVARNPVVGTEMIIFQR
jgi:hypothetical protein